MFIHCFTWTLGLCLLVSVNQVVHWSAPSMLFIGHWLMDAWKVRKVEAYPQFLDVVVTSFGSKETEIQYTAYLTKRQSYFNKLLIIDQIFHVIQIIALVLVGQI